MFEKWRQIPTADIAIFIDGSVQHYSAIVPVPSGIIRTTPEERDTKWRSANNHQISFLFCFWQTFSAVSLHIRKQILCLL
jgi:hypothetical protein